MRISDWSSDVCSSDLSSPVKSSTYRPLYRIFFWILVADVLLLGWCGMQPAEQPWLILSQLGAIYYFAHFLVILPIVSRIERPLPMPNSITEADRKSGV